MEYRAITAENFYLIEMRNTCKFILENKVEEDLKKMLKANNILEAVSESNFSKKFNTINKRLKSLTDNLKKQIVDTDLTSARFINLYSILCNERFILEFLEEVVKEKYDNYDYSADYWLFKLDGSIEDDGNYYFSREIVDEKDFNTDERIDGIHTAVCDHRRCCQVLPTYR